MHHIVFIIPMMLTRYQRNASLYADVLENPLVLQNIFQHLEANDVLNVVITGAPFTKTHRFQHTLIPFLEEQKEIHEERIEEHRNKTCIATTKWYLDTIESMQREGCPINQLVVRMCGMFDHLAENTWFLEKNPKFARVVEDKIIGQLYIIEFTTSGLEYLRMLFSVTEQVELDDNEEELWFVVTSYGKKVYF